VIPPTSITLSAVCWKK